PADAASTRNPATPAPAGTPASSTSRKRKRPAKSQASFVVEYRDQAFLGECDTHQPLAFTDFDNERGRRFRRPLSFASCGRRGCSGGRWRGRVARARSVGGHAGIRTKCGPVASGGGA